MTNSAARRLQAVRQWKLRMVLIIGVATRLHLAVFVLTVFEWTDEAAAHAGRPLA